MAEQTFEHAGNRFTVTLTLGISCCGEGEPLETCIARADAALYRGKTGGRNRCETNPPTMASEST